jgi:hypothetical protein
MELIVTSLIAATLLVLGHLGALVRNRLRAVQRARRLG